MAKVLLLIVEDDIALAEMYATKFKSVGYKIDIAHNGAEGYEKIKTEHPDLVLMDVLMPELSGLEALKKAKKDPQTRRIPIIILTNQPSETEQNAALAAGAEDYLLKVDLTPTQVVERVKALLSDTQPPSIGSAKRK